jgi:hypothetical protein
LFAGRGIYQSGERGVCVHAGARDGRRPRDRGARPAGEGADMPVPVVLVHGQRDQLPAEAVPRRGVEGQVLGSVSLTSTAACHQPYFKCLFLAAFSSSTA